MMTQSRLYSLLTQSVRESLQQWSHYHRVKVTLINFQQTVARRGFRLPRNGECAQSASIEIFITWHELKLKLLLWCTACKVHDKGSIKVTFLRLNSMSLKGTAGPSEECDDVVVPSNPLSPPCIPLLVSLVAKQHLVYRQVFVQLLLTVVFFSTH